MPARLSKKENLIPISEAAKILGVSVDTIRRWDKSGVLHSQRLNGKDRYFDLKDLEKIKFSSPLSISDAAEHLGISASTLRRLEKKGLLKPKRSKAGERIYNAKDLERF